MRVVRYSVTAEQNFLALLQQGADKFGVGVAAEKRRLLIDCVNDYLTVYPHHGLRTRGKPFLHYPVQYTPFTIVYEYDDKELRILFILHKRADRQQLDLTDVTWLSDKQQ